MNSKFRFALAVLALVSSHEAFAAPSTDACSMLTAAQVGGALGSAVGEGKPAGPHVCEWSQPPAGFRGKSVWLEIVAPVGKLSPADRFNTMKMPVPPEMGNKTAVTGLGDDALYITPGKGAGVSGTTLAVKKGGFVFRIRVSGFPLEESKTKEKTLAQDVLAKL